jgi:putative aldouronate transport system permease protein
MALRRMDLFDWVNTALLILFALTTLYPFWNILVVSFSTDQAYFADWYHVVPRSFSLRSYAHNFGEVQVVRSLLNSLFVTAAGTALAVLTTVMAAYFLSKSWLRLQRLFFRLFIFTMFFNGGLIPQYLLVTRLGLRNTLLALFLPSLLSTYFLIITKNYLAGIPESLEESARIDGANDLVILVRIVMPTAKPIVMTISLFYAVQFWNDWFNGLLYLTERRLYPLSLYLREMISNAITTDVAAVLSIQAPATIRAAAIVITVLPIVLVYPFIQKHFVKGILLGASKE